MVDLNLKQFLKKKDMIEEEEEEPEEKTKTTKT